MARPATSSPSTRAGTTRRSKSRVRLTHPDKMIYPADGICKRRLAEYYVAVADRILPHVADRPLSLVRCPDSAEGECFFRSTRRPVSPTPLSRSHQEKDGNTRYLYIEDVRGLVACANGCTELHIWGRTTRRWKARPHRLRPRPDGTWASTCRDAAHDMRDRLKALGLVTFPMATGGKGSIVAPLAQIRLTT